MTNSEIDRGVATAVVSTPLDALRKATSDYHGKLEAAIDWPGAFQSLAAYRNLLQRFARVVPPLEQAISQRLTRVSPPQFQPGLRSSWLQTDLATLHALLATSESSISPEPVDSTASGSDVMSPLEFGFVDSVPAAVGALYVLEGSSLGGQYLSRQLHERLQLTAVQGGAYFNGFGADTGRHWQAFRSWANAQLSDAPRTEGAVEAAKQTFARFGEALAEIRL